MDVVHLAEGNFLHIICSGTGFQQEKFINKISADSAWRALKLYWINVYAGAPDLITSEAGSKFTVEEINQAASSMGIIIKAVLTEAHHRIRKVERGHAIFRSV